MALIIFIKGWVGAIMSELRHFLDGELELDCGDDVGGGRGLLHVRCGVHSLPHLLHPAQVPAQGRAGHSK